MIELLSGSCVVRVDGLVKGDGVSVDGADVLCVVSGPVTLSFYVI